jgi:uncharacterized protein (TIGR03663 family)
MLVEAAPVAVMDQRRESPRVGALPEVSERVWLASCIVILIVATVLRVYSLELKPAHHDEGVNGFFMTTLVNQGVYKYDPTNYHGPTLYYLALPTTVLFGLGTLALRAVTAIFGIGTVWLIFALRRQLGTLATLAAASLLAVSPGAVYYSRYFIHESLFAFFTLGIVVAAVRFYETRRLIFVAAGSISAALLFATKETAFVSVITLGLAWIFVELWVRKIAGSESTSSAGRSRRAKSRAAPDRRSLRMKLFEGQPFYVVAALAVGLFILVNLIFYSSFFSNWQGVNDAVSALAVWSKTGTSEFHGKPFDTYSRWLVAMELPILLLAIAGSAIALFERQLNRFAIFVGAWGFGLFLAYSLIPYKTPWLMLNFTVPMAIVGGYAIPALATRLNFGKAWISASLVGLLALSVGAYQSVVLNFRHYDDDAYPYVYAHTNRESHTLIAEVERLTARTNRKDVGISVASPEYWPLPWYWRNNPRVGFAGSISTAYDPNETPLVIGRESADPAQDQSQTLNEMLAADYRRVGSYKLRPGVSLVLFASRQLAQP